MQYQLAFGYFVGQKPNGWTNLLLATVCLFIPVVGPLVLMGYQAEMTERLLRDPDLRRHPDFSFDRFMELLTRGVWPFLVGLVVALLAVPVLVLAVMVAVGIGASVDPILGAVLAVLIYVGGILLLNAVMIPIQFHAELANRFDLRGGFRFAVSFLKLVGGKALVAYLVFNLLTIPLTLVGLLACFIGVYPAVVVAMMAGQHLMAQLYLDYLSAGGEEIVKTPTDADRRRRRRDAEDAEYDDEDDRGRRPRLRDDEEDDDQYDDDRGRRR